MDEVTPAVDSATGNAETVETPTTATAEAVVESASTPVEPSLTPAKPDLESFLSDPELRKDLLKHPAIAKEIEQAAKHRFDSERGRIKAELERQQQERQQAEAARAERQRLLDMDEFELGTQTKQQVQQQLEEEALQARLQPLRQNFENDLLRNTGREIYSTVYALAKEAGATDAELDELDPVNYPTLGDYFKGTVKFMSTREGKKLAKEMAKVEAKAMLEERIAAEREANPMPENLAPAEPGQSESDFMASYATGRNNDSARQIRWMRENGIPV